jgi:hypothetical protein
MGPASPGPGSEPGPEMIFLLSGQCCPGTPRDRGLKQEFKQVSGGNKQDG